MVTLRNENDSLIERALRKAIAFVVVTALMIPLLAPGVFAASTVSISGGDNVKGGDTFTVAVTFDGGNIGRVDGHMTYDTNKLTYLGGGTSTGNTGYIQLKTAGTSGSIVFNIEFQAVSEGTAALEVITDEMYDLDEVEIDRPTASKAITISGNADAGVLITEAPDPEEPVDATELVGVDEKTEGVSENSLNAIFIIAAAVLVILIVIISIILAKKKKKPQPKDPSTPATQPTPPTSPTPQESQMSGNGVQEPHQAKPSVEPVMEDKPRIGRSGKILNSHAERNDSWLDELMAGGNAEVRQRDRSHAVKKQANEETELWREWDLNSRDDSDDIEKW